MMKAIFAIAVLLVIQCINAQNGSGTSSTGDCTWEATDSSCSVGCKCYEFTIAKVSPYTYTYRDGTDVERTDITFEVTNNCKWAVSYIAIGTGGLKRIAPVQGSKYRGVFGTTYTVEWTNLNGNPSFESIKFVAGGDLYKNGKTEIFTITVEGYRADYVWNFQGHNGATWETFSGLTIQNCDCDCPDTECDVGFTGADCSECASVAGYTYLCLPQEGGQVLLGLIANENVTDVMEEYENSAWLASDSNIAQCNCQPFETEWPCNHLFNCTGNGICLEDATCQCTNPDFTGAACDVYIGGKRALVQDCRSFYYCSGHGTCNNGACDCESGFEGPYCLEPLPTPTKCADFMGCSDCLGAPEDMNCTWCMDSDRMGCTADTLCSNEVYACEPSPIPYTPEPCPDKCAGHGICENDVCKCDTNWVGVNCAILELTPDAVVAVSVSTVALALIIAGAVVFAGLSGFGAKRMYDWYRLRESAAGAARSNPMYEDAGNRGSSSLYEPKGNSNV